LCAAVAAKAQETADILSGTARLARKRAEMANELVATLLQTVEISENITSWNVKVVNLGNEVQSAGECLITSMSKI
jgi:hypothetical protein